MGTAITLAGNGKAQVPEHLRHLNDQSNIEERGSVPSLSYGGKVWALNIEGERHPLMRVDPDTGDEEARPTIRAFILGYAKDRGRTYYEGDFDPDNISAPACWSNDGKLPDKSIEEPQCATCADCPMAIKGSKISESGKEGVACSQHRMLAVLPVTRDMNMRTPLRLKIAVTSDWDKENKEAQAKNWFGFTQYLRSLKASGINHTAAVVTKMRFDSGVNYPKIQFAADSWAEEYQSEAVNPLVDSDEVNALLSGTWGASKEAAPAKPSLPKGQDDDDDVIEAEVVSEKPKPAPKKAAAKPKPKPAPEPEPEVADDDDDDLAQFATAAAAVAEPEVVEEVEEEAPPPKPAPKKAAAKKAPPKEEAAVPEGVAGLLGDWDDE